MELPTPEETKEELREFFASRGHDIDEETLDKLTIYFQDTIVEAMFYRQTGPPWLLDQDFLNDIHRLEG